ncbi:MAG: hypothetical protein WDM78_11725 [Puia sp.]
MNYKKKDSGLSETKNGKADLLDKPLVKNGKKSRVGNKLSNGIKLKETGAGTNGHGEKSFLNSREFLRFLSEMRNGISVFVCRWNTWASMEKSATR